MQALIGVSLQRGLGACWVCQQAAVRSAARSLPSTTLMALCSSALFVDPLLRKAPARRDDDSCCHGVEIMRDAAVNWPTASIRAQRSWLMRRNVAIGMRSAVARFGQLAVRSLTAASRRLRGRFRPSSPRRRSRSVGSPER